MRVFVSYRHSDSIDITGRICDRLRGALGRDAVFRDTETTLAGTGFQEHVLKAIASCNVLLTVIGPDWVSAHDSAGRRRIDSRTDLVRLEIEAAFERGLPIVPILVREASMPGCEELPDSLKPLEGLFALPVRSDSRFDDDVKNVLDHLHRLPGGANWRSGQVEVLGDYLARRAPLSEPMAVDMALTVARRLAGAHARGEALGWLDAEKAVVHSQGMRRELEPRAGATIAGLHDREKSLREDIRDFGRMLAAMLGLATPSSPDSDLRISKQARWLVTACLEATLSAPLILATLQDLAPSIGPAESLTPWNLDFEEPAPDGMPPGWSNSVGQVDGVSDAYEVEVVPRGGGDIGRCVRIRRKGAAPTEFGSLMQRCPASFLAGHIVKIEAEIRCVEVQGWCGLWLRIDRARDMEFFENMADRPIRGTTPWRTYLIETPQLSEEVKWLNFGIVLSGGGEALATNFRLFYQTSDTGWRPLNFS